MEPFTRARLYYGFFVGWLSCLVVPTPCRSDVDPSRYITEDESHLLELFLPTVFAFPFPGRFACHIVHLVQSDSLLVNIGDISAFSRVQIRVVCSYVSNWRDSAI